MRKIFSFTLQPKPQATEKAEKMCCINPSETIRDGPGILDTDVKPNARRSSGQIRLLAGSTTAYLVAAPLLSGATSPTTDAGGDHSPRLYML